MEKIHLSPRLDCVLHFVPKVECLADIGSDHAHLPCRAVQIGRADSAIAGEVRTGPLYQSTLNVTKQGLRDRIDVRLGDGLDVLREQGEASAIVIAGMGGELIADILERGKNKIGKKTVLILQPNSREPRVRRWLVYNGWTISDEAIVNEGHHVYEVIQASQGSKPRLLSEPELMMGPVLSSKQDPLFIKKWKNRERRLSSILTALRNTGQSEEVLKKIEANQKELQWIRSYFENKGAQEERKRTAW
ncbi:tRNA (adenine(22)-N(1))-methyltransferase [Sporolactobacillus terrae]|uniref:tRNA (adenine(22)-N(1))-methyltransferase n=1 Tax=Sporolactobacillus terrae TaxID=269673 RepID=UPI001118E91C|nr:class I SAM-dependent methyltransferase [Sporolactobacillus terrae]